MTDLAANRTVKRGMRLLSVLALVALMAQLMIPIFSLGGNALAQEGTSTSVEQQGGTSSSEQTPIPPTETPIPQPTDTPVPPATDTPVPAPTETPIPAATDTPAPAATEVPTQAPVSPPTIVSDKADYAPGELVTLTGSNWQPGESVNIFVNDDKSSSWSRNVNVVANADGAITDSFNLPTWFVATYSVKATGTISGVATTTFTDGNVTLHLDLSEGVTSYTVNFVEYSDELCSKSPDNKSITITTSTTANLTGGNKSATITSVTPSGSGRVFDKWTRDSNSGATYIAGCVTAPSGGNSLDLWAHFKITNVAPVAAGQVLSTNEDTPLSITLSATDANGQSLTFNIASTLINGTLGSIGPVTCNVASGTSTCTASVTYTPNSNFNGFDSFTYTANDGLVSSVAATVSIAINAVNDAPSFVKGANQAVNEDAGAQTVSGWATAISAGPSNESGQTLNFIVSNNNNSLFSSQPSIAANGTLTYTPAANANGIATVTVQIHDNGGTANGGVDTSASQTFTITVNPVNDDPVATVDSATVTEDSVNNVIDVLANDSDGVDDGETLSVDSAGGASHGTAVEGSGPNANKILYTPNTNYFGPDSFTYTISDGNGGTETATVSINVTAVNDAPLPADDTATTNEDTTLYLTQATLTANDSEGAANESAQDLTISEVSNPLNGTVAIVAADDPDASGNVGKVRFVPTPNYHGSASFDYKVCDNGTPQQCSVGTATVNITVNPVNDDPVAVNDAASTNEDTQLSLTQAELKGNDTDVDNTNAQLSVIAVSGATNGTAVLNGDGTVTFTPTADYFGTAGFDYTVSDGALSDEGQTFTITVRSVNDAPSFTAGGNQSVLEDAGAQSVSWASAISAGPTNESGQVLIFVVTNDNNALFASQPAIAPNGTLTYTPAANANGVVTVTVLLKDDGGTANGGIDKSSEQTFTITVTAVNDAPSFAKGPDKTLLEDAGAQTFASWATGISAGPSDESSLSLTFNVTNNNNALFSAQPAISSAGTLTFTPAPNANGSATVSVSLQDNGGTANGGVDTSATQTFEISVTAVNDAPSFVKGADQTVAEDSGLKTESNWATSISAGPADEAGQGLTFYVSNDNNALFSGQPAVASNGTLTFTPAAHANGSATVSVYLKDNGGTANGGVDTSATQTFIITITEVNDAPSANADAASVAEDGVLLLTQADLTGNDSKGPANESGQTLAVTAVTATANTHGTVELVASGPDTGKIRHTPDANYNGPASFSYTVKDNGTTNGAADPKSATGTVNVTVTPVSDAPTVTITSFTVDPVTRIAKTDLTYGDFDGLSDLKSLKIEYLNGTTVVASQTYSLSGSTATSKTDQTSLTAGCYSDLKVRATVTDNEDLTGVDEEATQAALDDLYVASFQAPIKDNERNLAKAANVVPVKVVLTSSCSPGTTITNQVLYVQLVAGTQGEEIYGTEVITESVSAADTGNQMRVVDGKYMYNLSTKGLTTGKDYTIQIRTASETVILTAVLRTQK